MSQYFRPISISLSPNVQRDDLKLALNLIIRPWLWKKGRAVSDLENEFKKYLGVKYAFSFNSGRSALFAILQSLNLKKADNVLLQAFTCNAVPNPILWADLEPVYLDCDADDFNASVSELEAKISTKTRVAVIQHTFGLPADMDRIKAICDSKNVAIIEDCAHALGAEFKGKKVGTFGKAAFFSLSRDKVISSVYGGMAVTDDDAIATNLSDLQKKFGQPSSFWIFQQIFHPILLNYVILPIYNFFDLGKLFLVLSQVLHLLSKAVSWKEKRGQRPDYFPRALPNALAAMALNQFSKLGRFNERRQSIAEFYYQNLKETSFELPKKSTEKKNVFLRFAVKHPNAHDIIYEAWHKQNILLGDWYTTVIAPFDTKLSDMKYEKGMCPVAERLAKRTLNLPTHVNISMKDAERIVNFLKKWN